MSTVLSVSDLSRSYKRGPELVHALRSVSFALEAGEVVALAGPSGSGKSTLLNIVGGWEYADKGEVTWGTGVTAEVARDWLHMGLIPQRLGLLEDLTAAENVQLPLLLSNVDRFEAAERAEEWMDRLDIAHLSDRLPAAASLGEQQRICAARALIMDPAVILADEPTGNQDAARRGKVFAALREVASRGGACLVATHDPHVIEHCDRILRLQDGEVESDEMIEALSPWQRRREDIRP